MRRRRFAIGGAALLLGACGGLTADRAERRRREAEARYPAPNRNAVIAGARVSADQRGSGPDVVLIHGASGSSRDFTFALSDLIAREGFQERSFGHRKKKVKFRSSAQL